jgi:uncharacterized protein (TIGR02246 family)
MRRSIAIATAEAAEEAFYDAMQRGDLAAMMALWADDEDVVCTHPNGARLVGISAIRESFAAIFRQGGVDVRPSDVRIHQGGTIAAHNLVEKVLVAGPSGTRVVECVATNVYAKTASGWRIVLHHSASVSDTGEPAPAPPAVLH